MGSLANVINASLVKNLSFDFSKDLTPISLATTLPNILVVNPKLGVSTVSELIAQAKKNPKKINFASSGNGTSPHMSGELFNQMAGIELVHVPYKGSAQATTDLIAGEVQVMFSPSSTVLNHIKSGTLIALASTGTQRLTVLPDLKTVDEQGLKGFETSIWFGLLAPVKTNPEILNKLANLSKQALADPEIISQLKDQGIEVINGSPKEFDAYIQSETTKWAAVVKASKAQID